jgi:hypothetical protein
VEWGSCLALDRIFVFWNVEGLSASAQVRAARSARDAKMAGVVVERTAIRHRSNVRLLRSDFAAVMKQPRKTALKPPRRGRRGADAELISEIKLKDAIEKFKRLRRKADLEVSLVQEKGHDHVFFCEVSSTHTGDRYRVPSDTASVLVDFGKITLKGGGPGMVLHEQYWRVSSNSFSLLPGQQKTVTMRRISVRPLQR